MNAEIEQVIDEALPPVCCGYGRSLPRPGVRCPECGTYPDPTREEFARQLLMPGALSLDRADTADRAAESLMRQFVAAAGVPDRLRYLAVMEGEAAEAQEALAEAVALCESAQEAVTAAEEAEAAVRKPLAHVLELGRQAEEKLTEVQRTLEGDEAEWRARIAIAELRPIIARRQHVADEYAAVTALRRRELEEADRQVAMWEQARDEDATARLHLDEVRPSAARVVLLARPLRELMAGLLADQEAGIPPGPEWEALLGVLYEMAGAAGLLGMAEEGAMPRVLGELAGPLSGAEDVAQLAQRIPRTGSPFPRCPARRP